MFDDPYSLPSRRGYRTMTLDSERSDAAWFEEAARCYVEGHQACAWCGESHCVFERRCGSRVEYSCIHCDFFVCRDEQTGQIHVAPGKVLDTDPVMSQAG
jgi:hypothetical protein